MIKTQFVLAFLASFALASCASKTPAPESGAMPANPEVSANAFIDPQTVDTFHVIPGPPMLHTPEADEDFKTLKEWQHKRTEAECEIAKTEVEFKSFLSFFQKPRGPLNEAEVTRLKPFFDQILMDSRPVWVDAKNHWVRPRPYYVDPSIKPCVKLETNFSYPSGHAGAGELFGKILSDLYPKRKKAFMARGFDIGEHRILGGVHHPSDVRDGRTLADQIYIALNKNPHYLKAFNEIKKNTK